MVDFSLARQKMVDSQIRPNGVTSHAVIAAFLKIERETFVPADQAGLAYLDRDAPLSSGRALTAPMVLARMIQALALVPGDKVLEIGTATGYGAAILAELGTDVVALEEDPALTAAATANLAATAGVRVVGGALNAGFGGAAPYRAILINGAVEVIPNLITRQLTDGGRLAAVVGHGKGASLTLYTKVAGALSGRLIANLPAPALPGFARAAEFVF